ncbi:acyltransferase family protein [Roseateles asaccharophilus]|uniref:Peptidoglycan/LPS O-acetylase OafA/YrhL n=1 Tax=Roseateles asaccharophilus TaxID=582607 RepID=A0ABU2ADI4_9BURK|nr:acyltransferase family protein [Roseateles asaccharophilus]MDR7335273.1 peptidoglycan/LPS O-acetylase OafA/YrhL [Roseateles asaccharophilus]
MSTPLHRLPQVDLLKALAAQVIVLHHLVSYGPIARAAHDALPALAGLLQDYGRMAVQVFLVVGGYLSARALSPRGGALQAGVAALLWRRYLRLVLPFLAALALTLGASALITSSLPELLPSGIGAVQLLAHALLLHDVLGYEALTVGAWYVAIDLQLFALLLGLLWLARRGWRHPGRQLAGPLLVAGMALASAFFFNLDATLDVWAPYFFAAYGLGALVHWLGCWRHGRAGLALLVLAASTALLLDWRDRLALALATALWLAWAQTRQAAGRAPLPARWGDRLTAWATPSYALFLLHFPVLLLTNALLAQWPDAPPAAGVALLVATWALAHRLAPTFHRWVELPAARWDPLAWLPRPRTA